MRLIPDKNSLFIELDKIDKASKIDKDQVINEYKISLLLSTAFDMDCYELKQHSSLRATHALIYGLQVLVGFGEYGHRDIIRKIIYKLKENEPFPKDLQILVWDPNELIWRPKTLKISMELL